MSRNSPYCERYLIPGLPGNSQAFLPILGDLSNSSLP